ncbi:hypothetical protein [Goodfellowiella coeruleoviolacea]|uniref:Uncharacterized protein n=1 Tax=Goodfellowiella coeruleoviolacea TaxID=334858 RepID=A0AAE3GA93_9PSEU|nr:hypothetical protein [Goodfellowiella coeruleoviolacea]MCP2164118.1 hypothetical protein [Goodfellowiella coeruleoviolacea]
MANNRAEGGKGRILEHGHFWITAVTGLILAVGTFFAGRSSTSDQTGTTTTATVTATVTETVTNSAGGVTAASGQAAQSGQVTPAEGEPGVRLAGEVTFGRLNLDFREPRPVAGKSITRLGDDWLYSEGGFALAEWQQSDSVPGKEQCAAETAARGSGAVDGLVTGSLVCGTTPEGRVFRLEVLGLGENIRTRAVVWEK